MTSKWLLAALLAPALAQAQATRAEIVPLPQTVLPLKHAPERTGAEISAKDLMTRLYIFADDSMQGREAGAVGNVKGTDYIAAEAKRMGLQPAGENGTYFQTVPMKLRSTDAASTLSVGGVPLTYGTEWAGLAMPSATGSDLPVVYGGVLGDSVNVITPAQAEGKVVIFGFAGRGGGMQSVAAKAAAVGLILPAQFMGFVTGTQAVLDDSANAPPASGKATLYISSSAISKVFDGTPAVGASGKSISFDIRSRLDPVPFPARNVVAILPGSDPALRGEYVAIGAHNDHVGFNHAPVDHDSIRIFNHIVRPEGAENQGVQATPQQQAQVDSTLAAWRRAHPGTSRPDSIFNGADDDGSGSVSVLEIAEQFAASRTKPRRSLLFVWHVGEEKGLFGSTFFTDHPTVTRDSIVAQLNMDMVGRGDAWDVTGTTKEGAPLHGNPNYLQIIGSHRLSTELGDLIEKVNTEDRHGLQFDYALDANGHPDNIYCRSDHYEYARYGIPIAFFTTGIHSDYHQVTDEPEYIDYEHMARVDRFIADVATHVANLDHRIVVDHPKPDPHGSCQQ